MSIGKITKNKMFWPVVALVLIMLLNLIMTPNFFSIQIKDGHLFGSVIDILNRAAPLVILSLGMMLVIATEGIDISVGSIVAITGAMTAFLLQQGVNVFVAIIIGVALGAVCGIWNGTLVAKIGIQPMVATLILMTIGRGIAQLITNGQIIGITNKTYNFIGNGYIFGLPFPFYMALGCGVIVYFLSRKTAYGLFLESVGCNRKSSEYSGINAKRTIITAYIICGLLAGVAALIISADVKSADANNAGLWMELDAILAAVIGGTSMSGGRFYIGGTIIGALFIQSLTTTIYSLGVPPEIILLVKAAAVISVSLIQSDEFRKMFKDIRGKRERKEVGKV